MKEWIGSLAAIRRRPGVAALVVFTLALGIGANTALFSAVDGVLLRPLAYADSDHLVALFATQLHRDNRRSPTSPADFLAWSKDTRTLTELTAAHPWSPILTGRDQPEPIPALKATSGLFGLLGAEAALGRAFSSATAESEGDVVVLGHRLWQRRFGGDPAIVGQALVLDGVPHTVIGVMPPGFQFPPFWATDAEMWAPLRMNAQSEANHSQFLRVFARRRAGLTVAQVQAEMDLIARRLEAAWPGSNTGTGVNVEALRDPVVSRVRPALLVLFGAVAFVLLIACANVSGLLLAQGLSREKELALRSALGAGRGRIVRDLLRENLVLALAGGLLGLWVADRSLVALRHLAVDILPRLDEVHLDGRVAAFNLALSLLTGLASGLLPALRASRADVAVVLRQGERGVGTSGRQPVHDALVVAEFALALVLLIGAGLLGKSFLRLLHPEPGFRTGGLLTLTVSLSDPTLKDPAAQPAFLDEVVRRTRSLPGVETVAFVNHLPIAGDTWGLEFAVEGRPSEPGNRPSAVYRTVTPDYPRTLGLRLLAGREFGTEDRADTAPVVLVNEALARRYWPGAEAVGQRIRPGEPDSDDPWLTVVGVFGDARQSGLTEPVRPEVLFPYAQNPVAWFRSTTLVVHASADPLSLAEPVKAAVRAVNGNVPLTKVRSMAGILADSVGQERLGASLLGVFAAAALGLAIVGLYGVTAYGVSRRRREFGIRLALGARASAVFGLILRRGLILGSVGAAFGLLGATALSRLLASLLFEVRPIDPAVYAGLTGLLMAVSLLACAVPALRAARVDPLAALRDE